MKRNSFLIVSKQLAADKRPLGRARVSIGAFQFHNKRAAELHVRDILERHDHMQRLVSDDYKFVRALLDLHPNYAKIIDCGIDSIFVQHIPGARRFVVRRSDSSWRDFSWRKAIYPKPALGNLSAVLRGLIRDQITEYRDRFFEGCCAVCAEPIRLANCHVDHIPPMTFQRLVADWLFTVRLTADDISIRASAGYEVWSRLEDGALEQSWQEYHAINARLRCVCKNCNLSTIRRPPPPKEQ